MTTQGKVSVNDYVYRQVVKKVNYCSEIRSKNLNEMGNHPDFSPNNIKRLVISPDMVLVYYHVSTEHNPIVRQVPLDIASVQKAQQMEDYVPALTTLVKPYVCSAIQEIIFIKVSSKVPNFTLIHSDMDLSILQKNYNGSGDALKSRYKRLGAIGIFNGSIEEFISIDNTIRKENKKVHLYLKYPSISNKSKVTIVNEEWYKHIIGGMSSTNYDMDKKDGRLNLYSYKIRESILKKLENKEFEEYKKEKVVEKNKATNLTDIQKDNLNVALKDYMKVVDCIMTILVTLQNKHNSYIGVDSVLRNNKPQTFLKVKLVELKGFDIDINKTKKYNIILLNKENLKCNTNEVPSLTQLVNFNIKQLNDAKEQAYNWFFDLFVDEILCGIKQRGTLVYKVMLNSFDRAIKVPNNSREKVEYLSKNLNVDFNGSNFNDSLANLCSLYSICFLTNQDNNILYDYMTKDYWLNKLTK